MSLSGRATGRALLPDEDIAFDHGNRNLHEPPPETPGAINFAGHIDSPARMYSKRYMP